MDSLYHRPVMLNESIAALNIENSGNGVYIDATFGGGGHSREILNRLGKGGRLIAFDQDQDAIANTIDDERVILVHNNFRFIHNFVKYNGFEKVDGVLADLGVSSHQFDCGERGFSFRFDAPLDMRMNQRGRVTAADIVNGYTKEELAKIFRIYGELDNPQKAADLIVAAREKGRIETTGDLSNAVSKLYNSFTEHKFLAKLYQALRIEVNMEMLSLEMFLKGALTLLKSGGRMVVITYHSLEDRMVKNFMKSGNIDGKIEKDDFGRIYNSMRVITKKPMVPDEKEISENPRSRSAKLRVAEKI